jgi:hypothetical protein
LPVPVDRQHHHPTGPEPSAGRVLLGDRGDRADRRAIPQLIMDMGVAPSLAAVLGLAQCGPLLVAARWPPACSLTGIAGHMLTCLAVTSTGTLLAWGSGGAGTCGDGTAADRSAPVATFLPAETTIAEADAFWTFAAAVTGPPPP